MGQLTTTRVFELNLDAYSRGYRYIINQGGARSGKTYAILQLLYLIAKYGKEPVLISVVSQTLPHLKRGAIRDFERIVQMMGYYNPGHWNKTDMTYTIGKSKIEFFSVDNPGKAYGAARDYLFLNEVNNVPEEVTRQLVIRTRRTVFMDFNPVAEFYVHTDYINRDGAILIKTTHLDNDYLDETVRQELIETASRNDNFKRVFLFGEVGVADDVVFRDWEYGPFDNSLQYLYGQDFGYVNDPTTLVKVAVDERNKVIYADECYYKPGLTTSSIAELDKQYAGNALIVADSAEPRLIDELRRAGLNVKPAVKGSGSVAAGLLTMQDYKIVITQRSANLAKELTMYRWLDYNSKLTVDAFNHAIDAIRYAFDFITSGRRNVLVTKLVTR